MVLGKLGVFFPGEQEVAAEPGFPSCDCVTGSREFWAVAICLIPRPWQGLLFCQACDTQLVTLATGQIFARVGDAPSRRLLQAGEAAKPLAGEHDAFLPHGQRDAEEGATSGVAEHGLNPNSLDFFTVISHYFNFSSGTRTSVHPPGCDFIWGLCRQGPSP